MLDDDALDELADREGEKMGAGRNRTKGSGIAWGPLRNTKQKIVARKLGQKIGAASPPPPAILRQPGFDTPGFDKMSSFDGMLQARSARVARTPPTRAPRGAPHFEEGEEGSGS
jgi:hypothetical protein